MPRTQYSGKETTMVLNITDNPSADRKKYSERVGK